MSCPEGMAWPQTHYNPKDLILLKVVKTKENGRKKAIHTTHKGRSNFWKNKRGKKN
jgi:hypothetical protein